MDYWMSSGKVVLGLEMGRNGRGLSLGVGQKLVRLLWLDVSTMQHSLRKRKNNQRLTVVGLLE